jgi:hypothetical protein
MKNTKKKIEKGEFGYIKNIIIWLK